MNRIAFILGLVSTAFANAAVGQEADIHRAARAGRVDELRDALAADPASIDARGRGGMTPLQSATLGRDTAVARVLLEAGADVAARDDRGRTALHWTARELREELARLLIEHGADVNARDAARNTPLHLAARRRARTREQRNARASYVGRLIDGGADVGAHNDRGETPIHVAAAFEQLEMVQQLLPIGPPGHFVEKQTAATKVVTTADHPSAKPDLEALWRAERVARANVSDQKNRTPLHWAATGSEPAITRYLIEAGAQADAPDEAGDTPLHYAVRRLRRDTVLLLLDHGASVDARNRVGFTPLMALAATPGDRVPEHAMIEVADVLLQAGADRSAEDAVGHTASEIARIAGREKLADKLAVAEQN